MELRDRNGLTEKEFLEQYTPKNYPRPSVTVDIVVMQRRRQGLRVLLVRRGGHPYLGCWALPGGFVSPGETTAQAAERELEEETHVKGLDLYPLEMVSTPGRDPRTWTMTQPYAALVEKRDLPVQADDDASDAQWFDVSVVGTEEKIRIALTGENEVLRAECMKSKTETHFGEKTEFELLSQQGLAFDHGVILAQAFERLKM